MKNRENVDTLGFGNVKHEVGKSRNDRTAHFPPDHRIRVREGGDTFEPLSNRRKKCLPQPATLRFVPFER